MKNPLFHDKSKHIEIKYHYIMDMVQRGAVKLLYVAMEEHIADVLTKPLARLKFEYFRERLGVLQRETWCSPDRGFLPETVMCPKAILTRRSDVRAEPFCHGERIQFLPCQI